MDLKAIFLVRSDIMCGGFRSSKELLLSYVSLDRCNCSPKHPRLLSPSFASLVVCQTRSRNDPTPSIGTDVSDAYITQQRGSMDARSPGAMGRLPHDPDGQANGEADSSAAERHLEERLMSLKLHDPAGDLIAEVQASPLLASLPQPRLPPEVLERVIRHLQAGAVVGDPLTQLALVRLSCVSRLIRHWALEALYSVLVLPRHVREFRKWYSRSVKSQPSYQFAGYTRALFCGLDDVSNLTSFSAGWDHELLRLLHYCGPSLTHLSLWRAESTALLRDPGQVREGYRFGTAQPVQMWGEPINSADVDEDEGNEPEAENEAATDEHAPPEAMHADDLFSKEELDDMPGWLKAEIKAQGTRAVTIRHKAHLTPTRRIRRGHQGCQPTHLSLMISLPLLEHEDPKVFSRMSIWYRVQELDVHIPTPGHTPKVLRLLASLTKSPIRRLRISTSFTTLCLMTPPFPPSRNRDGPDIPHAQALQDRAVQAGLLARINLCEALDRILRDDILSRVVVDELLGKHYNSVPHLEQLLMRKSVGQQSPSSTLSASVGSENRAGKDSIRLPSVAAAPDSSGLEQSLRITITRGNQAVWGKLKDRLWDFRQRAEGISDGSWELVS
ncbi:hypothetical protein BCV70DRAFT_202075 [Testicularia cyperi]|uniref:F-box domain-containing protein n=1 Tax=Testicularia cyperi TaxID=1882483 RepID=A0A317XJ10_9BASI|nr:hypothetical protein BCV70DRAFT_202075 [Testicularia cyperi]